MECLAISYRALRKNYSLFRDASSRKDESVSRSDWQDERRGSPAGGESGRSPFYNRNFFLSTRTVRFTFNRCPDEQPRWFRLLPARFATELVNGPVTFFRHRPEAQDRSPRHAQTHSVPLSPR